MAPRTPSLKKKTRNAAQQSTTQRGLVDQDGPRTSATPAQSMMLSHTRALIDVETSCHLMQTAKNKRCRISSTCFDMYIPECCTTTAERTTPRCTLFYKAKHTASSPLRSKTDASQTDDSTPQFFFFFFLYFSHNFHARASSRTLVPTTPDADGNRHRSCAQLFTASSTKLASSPRQTWHSLDASLPHRSTAVMKERAIWHINRGLITRAPSRCQKETTE